MSDQEERAILAVVAQLENENVAARRDLDERDQEAELRRQYTELLGLLPYELEPAAPSPQLKGRVLEAVRSEAEVIPFAAADRTGAVAGAPGRSRAMRLLAAAIVALSVGLGATGGGLYTSLKQQRTAIAELQATLERQGAAEQELAAVRREFRRLRDQFGLVTASGVEVCRLQPSGASPAQPQARGRLFVAADRRHWVLTARDLEPCAAGRAYHVWFRTEAGLVSAGSFRVTAGEPIEISRDDMPPGTSAVLVTLEESEAPSAPAGPTVLYGDEAQMML